MGTADIPNTHRLVQRSRNQQILGGMKEVGHDIVGMTCQDTYTSSRLPIPNPDGLIVASRANPRGFGMKGDVSNIIQMPAQGK